MASLPDPVSLALLLAGLGLLPFIAIMTTSFIKLVVVLSLVRSALGVQQTPPNMALYGLSIILTIYIMAPVGHQMTAALEGQKLELGDVRSLYAGLERAKVPVKDFLVKHAAAPERNFFVQTARELWPSDLASTLQSDDLLVLVPAFTVSELTAAFEIGFLLYLPFVAIDLIVSNILLAMGMSMVSPMTLSLPLKLFLFVMADGWNRLIHGLVLTYQ